MRNVAYSAFFLIFASRDPTDCGPFILYVSACCSIFSYVVDMNIEEYRSFCLSLGSDVEERMPFGAFKAAQGVLAFYVKGHIFSYFNIDNFTIVNLKCQPDRILSLKEQYPCISNPYNMSSKHWIGVDPTMASPQLLRSLTGNSYQLVKQKYMNPNRSLGFMAD